MNTVYQFPEHIITMAELKEYKQLQSELFGNAMFVVMDQSDPKVKRYDELVVKYLKLRQHAEYLKVNN